MLSGALIHPFETASVRLYDALRRSTVGRLAEPDVRDLVLNCFNRVTFERALAWKVGAHPDWWELRLLVEEDLPIDHCTVGRSDEECIAAALEQCRLQGYAEPSLIRHGSGWRLVSGAGLLAEVIPVKYDEVDEDRARRVERSLEGLRSLGDENRIVRRLRDIPGLDSVVAFDAGVRRPEPRGASVLNTSRAWVKVLRASLHSRLGLEIAHGNAQELLAAMLGFASWNELGALEGRCQGVARPQTIGSTDDAGRLLWRRHYRSQGAALWELGRLFSGDVRGLRLRYAGCYGDSLSVSAWREYLVPGVGPSLTCAVWPVLLDCSEEDREHAKRLISQ
jgi:hypothetical protein